MRRTIDWRFFLALAFALMVTYLAYAGWAGIEESKDKDVRIDALIESSQAKDESALVERRIAARERRIVASNQAALLDYTRSLARRQAALLAYLNRHGIEIPTRFVTPPTAPVLRDPSRAGQPNRPGGGTGGSNPPPTSSAPGNSGGNGGPRPLRNNGPGKSEHAPGHNKPGKRGKSEGHRGNRGKGH